MRAFLVLALLVALAPAAAAGSAEAPEMTDAAGDAGASGVALPAGQEDVDLLAAWFEGESVDSVQLVIQMAGAPKSRPNTIWFQAFEVAGSTKAAGAGDFPPFGTGALLCDYSAGSISNCMSIDFAWEGPALRLTLPRENLSAPGIGATATILEGASLGSFFEPTGTLPIGTSLMYDGSGPGLPYVFTKGPAVAANATEPPLAAAGPLANATAGAPVAPAGAPTNEAPAPGLALVAGAAALLAFARRRR